MENFIAAAIKKQHKWERGMRATVREIFEPFSAAAFKKQHQ